MTLFAVAVLIVSASFFIYKYHRSSCDSTRLSAFSQILKSIGTETRPADDNKPDGSQQVENVVDGDAASAGRSQGSNGIAPPALAITLPSPNLLTASPKTEMNGNAAQGSGKKSPKDKKLMPPPPPPPPPPPLSIIEPKASATLSFSMLPSTRSRATPPTLSTTLCPPPSAASTFRAPPNGSLVPSSSSRAPRTSTLAPPARPPKKVLLKPGHSPLDWAHLTSSPPTPTFFRGTDVPANLIRVTPSLLKQHTGRKGKNAWGVYQGRVYNLTPYMDFHPGGADQLMRAAGKEKEGERLFLETHPWINWENMLGECLVGYLVSEEEGMENPMEGVD